MEFALPKYYFKIWTFKNGTLLFVYILTSLYNFVQHSTLHKIINRYGTNITKKHNN